MIFAVLFLFIAPILIGANYLRLSVLIKEKNLKLSGVLVKKVDEVELPAAIFIAWITGFFTMLAIYQVVYIPFILTTQDFLPVHNIFLTIIGVLAVVSLGLNYYYIYKLVLNLWVYIKNTPWIYLLAIALIAYQLYFVFTKVFIDEDDAFFLPIAGEALATNKMFATEPSTGLPATSLNSRYAFSSYLMFIASLSKFTGIHHTIWAHTLLAVFYVLMSYIVCDILGNELFDNNRKKVGVFLISLSLINIFGQTSTISSQSLLLNRTWQGRSVIVAIILPMLLWLIIRIAKQKQTLCDWVMLFTLNLAAIALTSTGVYLTPLFLGVFTLSLLIFDKRVKILLPMLVCVIPNFITFFIYAAY